jgi:hypothetical protein
VARWAAVGSKRNLQPLESRRRHGCSSVRCRRRLPCPTHVPPPSTAAPEPRPSWLAPPAASTMKASGKVSYRQRSLGPAEGETGLQNTPPPCTSTGVERRVPAVCQEQQGHPGLRVQHRTQQHALPGALLRTARRSAGLASEQASWAVPRCRHAGDPLLPVCGARLAPGPPSTAACTAPQARPAPARGRRRCRRTLAGWRRQSTFWTLGFARRLCSRTQHLRHAAGWGPVPLPELAAVARLASDGRLRGAPAQLPRARGQQHKLLHHAPTLPARGRPRQHQQRLGPVHGVRGRSLLARSPPHKAAAWPDAEDAAHLQGTAGGGRGNRL